jgi:hypothetical protein
MRLALLCQIAVTLAENECPFNLREGLDGPPSAFGATASVAADPAIVRSSRESGGGAPGRSSPGEAC